MVEAPRLQAKRRTELARLETLQTWCRCKDGTETPPGMDPEIPKAGIDLAGGYAGKGYSPGDGVGAGT